jgi:hypothetical protein
MKQKFKRLNILIREEQYEKIQRLKLNLSGLVRDLIDDRFSDRRVVLSVTPETRAIYDKAISNFGASDRELEEHLLESIDSLLHKKVRDIDSVRKELKRAEKNND